MDQVYTLVTKAAISIIFIVAGSLVIAIIDRSRKLSEIFRYYMKSACDAAIVSLIGSAVVLGLVRMAGLLF